jgi:trimethylamine:corrinoid methyltransferase-like protein
VGPGGNYFTSEQTLASMLDLSDSDTMFSSLSLDSWKKQGKPSVEEELIETTKDLYTKAERLSAEAMDLVKKGEDFIEKQKS